MVLFVDACAREGSRTRKLAEYVLDGKQGQVTALRLRDIALPSVDEEFLLRRDALVRAGRRTFSGSQT